ncbi:MAG: 4'-phosphopantetheinyl transferase superfamily protein [Sphingobacteriia bacterium]|nr:4'-phosphopantetheinyl transferase superfamily protein [Sphingobacteriia bacterium]
MALFYQQNINEITRLAIWKIEEPEDFYLQKVPDNPSVLHPHKRLQHLAGRYLLQHLFADFPYTEMVIADTRKPYLPYEQYHFSISHCGDYAAAIVSKNERVGIDIEIPTVKVLKVAGKFLSNEELVKFQWANTNIQLATILWCAKEAMYKWWGWGAVDFKEMLRLHAFEPVTAGSTFKARFAHPKIEEELVMQYRIFEGLCLCWTHK